MSKIHVMTEDLANKIAAGEVVERISSVVKELVENSIDAKSKTIIVDLIDSGTKSIKVTDDGIGMDKEDALLCFERHATSKIRNVDDLFFINTLGFRGEALASIASVSKVDLRTSQGGVGTHIVIHGGKVIANELSDSRVGTIMEIGDLFYNTPARLKYLKSDATELASVTMYIEKLSLSHPDISFTLTNNGRRIVNTSGSSDLLKTIHEIYGYSVSSNMIEINVSNDDFDVHGYICKPSILKSNRNHFTTIVNGRIVKNMDVNRAINDAYFKFKHESKYPIVVLLIDTDPTLIDVNIHPTKQDIKISKIDSLYDLIVSEIQTSLKKTLLVTEVKSANLDFVPTSITFNETFDRCAVNEDEVSYENIEQKQMDFKNSELKTNEIYDEVRECVSNNSLDLEENSLIKKLELYPVGEVFGTYIVAQNEDAMYLIDHHGAQERINYERILEAFKSDKVSTIPMLVPLTIELTPSEFMIIKENMNTLLELGFIVEEFGINTYAVKEHPTWLISGREDEAIRKLFDIIIKGEYKFDKLRFRDHVAATMACKMSVRGNEPISMEQAENLIHDLVLCKDPYNCAHGRPTIITYPKYEIEKIFKRVMC